MQCDIVLPNNWTPRNAQIPAMNAWLHDNKLINDWIWHRRFGKDDCALHGTAYKAHQRVANYWHMLPQKDQVRKAVWDAINPRTGKRRIDEAFPNSICTKRDTDMFIKFYNGSTWQCLGSDNYKGAIGSAPAGIVWSEWALSDPSSYGYLAPILKDNGGWVVRQGTPRGKNHAYKTYLSGLQNPQAFSQLLTVKDTGIDKLLDLIAIEQEYIDLYGKDLGRAMYMQEYFCSFNAAVVGAVWGGELAKLEKDGRITEVRHNPNYPVFTAWDIGRTDSTAIWFFQVIANEILIIDYVEDNLKNPDYFASQLLGREITINLVDDKIEVVKGKSIDSIKHRQSYKYETIWLPHDARAKTFAAQGKAIHEQLATVFGFDHVRIVARHSMMDGITAARKVIGKMYVDYKAHDAIETVKQYRYEHNDKKQMLSDKPVHDWTSHAADAFRYLAIAYETKPKSEPKPPATKIITPAMTIDNLFDDNQW